MRAFRRLCPPAVVAAILLTTAPDVTAQTTTDEQALRDRLVANPADVTALLDLAAIALDQDRRSDAWAFAARARGVVIGLLSGGEGRPSAPLSGRALSDEQVLNEEVRNRPDDLRPIIALSKLYFDAGMYDRVRLLLTEAISRPAPGPSLAVRLAGDVPLPRRTHDVRPRYPRIASDVGIDGFAIIEALIGLDGRVERVQLLRSIEWVARNQGHADPKYLRAAAALDKAALEAVRQWRYEVTTVDDEPVAVIITVTVNFTLRKRP